MAELTDASSAEISRAEKDISLSRAAIAAGIGLLVMVATAPVAELYAYPKLVIANSAAATVANLTAHPGLFATVIFCYLITFICDVIVAWALFILLKPVNPRLSLLTAVFRWVYTVVALAALLNLVSVFRLLGTQELTSLFSKEQLEAQVMLLLRSYKSGWYFGLLFFSIHLGLLGYLILRSTYIPRILGVLLIITGLGYLLTNLRPYFFPGISTDFAKFTFYGELVFMLWLLIRGWKIGRSKNVRS